MFAFGLNRATEESSAQAQAHKQWIMGNCIDTGARSTRVSEGSVNLHMHVIRSNHVAYDTPVASSTVYARYVYPCFVHLSLICYGCLCFSIIRRI
jgi:poly-beta-hydroxyalkanoate depolymerase